MLHGINPDMMPPHLYSFLNSYCVCGTNIFFLITGWFGIGNYARSIYKFIFTVFSFNIINWLLCLSVGVYDIGGLARSLLFPISGSPYWFIQVYFILIIVSPLLNTGLHYINKKHLDGFIFMFTVATIYSCGLGHNISNDNGCSILQGIYMYCLGYYLNIHSNILSRFRSVYLFFGWLFIMTVGGLGLVFTGIQSFTSFNSIVNISASVMLFLSFAKIRLSSKLINRISSAAFGCFLLSDGWFGIYYLYNLCHEVYTKNSIGVALLMLLVGFIILWLVSLLLTTGINSVLQKIWNGWLERTIKRVRMGFTAL